MGHSVVLARSVRYHDNNVITKRKQMYPLICSPDGENAKRGSPTLFCASLRRAVSPYTAKGNRADMPRDPRALLFSFSILYQATIYFPCPPRYFSALRIRCSGGISWPSTKGFFGVCVSSLPLADLRLLIPANSASHRHAERRSLVDLVRREFQHRERENRAFLGL